MKQNRKTARPGSQNALLMEMEVGERRYVECTLEDYPNRMRGLNPPISRRPEALKPRTFATTLFTAVSANTAGDVRYLVCVERTS